MKLKNAFIGASKGALFVQLLGILLAYWLYKKYMASKIVPMAIVPTPKPQIAFATNYITPAVAASSSSGYNTPAQFAITTPKTIAANTAHKISFAATGGGVTVQFGTDPAVNYPVGTSVDIEAQTLVNKDVVFTPASGSTVYIQTFSA